LKLPVQSTSIALQLWGRGLKQAHILLKAALVGSSKSSGNEIFKLDILKYLLPNL
jgi:hypothetical protein